jgi:colanic acid/amylovoran biosynthesis glycosyltransferase
MAIGRESVAYAMGARAAMSLRGFDVVLHPLKDPDGYERIWERLDRVHTISNHLIGRARELGMPDRLPWEKIPPAIDVSMFCGDTWEPRTIRDRVEFLTVARLHWIKGLEATLEALALWSRRSGRPFRWRVIGDGDELECLVFAAHQLGIAESVEFCGRQCPDRVRGALEGSDIYLQFSLEEGFCNAVLEAQAAGLLCIVADAGGLRENVLDHETGWLVQRGDTAALAQKIDEVLALTAEQHSKVRGRASERVREEFTLERQTERFDAFYAS